MRRTVVTVMLAWCAGLCTATSAVYGVALLDAWRGFGEQFQLGYIVGYLDAITLSRRNDRRANVPTSGNVNYARWQRLVNEFFADPKNAKRSVPDGMEAAGKIIQAEILKKYQERAKKRAAAPRPSASGLGPEPAATPH